MARSRPSSATPRLLVGRRLAYSRAAEGPRLDVASNPAPRRRSPAEAVTRPADGFPDGVVSVDEPAGAHAVARSVWDAIYSVEGVAPYTPLPAQLRADLAAVAALVRVGGWAPEPGGAEVLAGLLPRCTVDIGGPPAGPGQEAAPIADLAMAGFVEEAHRAADRAVVAATLGAPGDRARALHERGTLAALLDRRKEAAADLADAAALHRQAGDAAAADLARHNLAAISPGPPPRLAWLVAAALLAVLVALLTMVGSGDATIDFGEVAVGDEARRVEELRNPTGGPLVVAIDLSEPGGSSAFAVSVAGAGACRETGRRDSAPVVAVPAGGSCDVALVFAPELPAGVAAAGFAGDVTFTVTGGRHAGGSWSVALRGRGVAGSALPTTAATTLPTVAPDRPPDVAALPDRSVLVGRPLDVAVTATDPDGDQVTLSADGLPAWATLTDNGDGTGAVTGTPTAADTGTTRSRITATANDRGDTEILAITVVAPPDRPPVLAPPGSHSVVAGQPLAVAISASDPNGDPITLDARGLPGWATLTDNGDGTGTVTGTPTPADTGTTEARITATANDRTVTETLTIEVEARPDEPPNLTNVGSHIVGAGQPLDVVVLAVDPDGDPVTLSGEGLPAWAGLTDNGDGTGTVTGTPTAADAGTTQSRITATANGRSDTETLTIIVIGPGSGSIDEPPRLANVGSHTVVAGEALEVAVTATDPDGDPIALSATELPGWATLTDNGDGTGAVTGTPTAADTGTTQSRVTATANDRTDTEILTIVVEEAP